MKIIFILLLILAPNTLLHAGDGGISGTPGDPNSNIASGKSTSELKEEALEESETDLLHDLYEHEPVETLTQEFTASDGSRVRLEVDKFNGIFTLTKADQKITHRSLYQRHIISFEDISSKPHPSSIHVIPLTEINSLFISVSNKFTLVDLSTLQSSSLNTLDSGILSDSKPFILLSLNSLIITTHSDIYQFNIETKKLTPIFKSKSTYFIEDKPTLVLDKILIVTVPSLGVYFLHLDTGKSERVYPLRRSEKFSKNPVVTMDKNGVLVLRIQTDTGHVHLLQINNPRIMSSRSYEVNWSENKYDFMQAAIKHSDQSSTTYSGKNTRYIVATTTEYDFYAKEENQTFKTLVNLIWKKVLKDDIHVTSRKYIPVKQALLSEPVVATDEQGTQFIIARTRDWFYLFSSTDHSLIQEIPIQKMDPNRSEMALTFTHLPDGHEIALFTTGTDTVYILNKDTMDAGYNALHVFNPSTLKGEIRQILHPENGNRSLVLPTQEDRDPMVLDLENHILFNNIHISPRRFSIIDLELG